MPEDLLTDVVLSWGLPRLRDLPWRRTRDPWQVLVAETMLQQTQVARVIPKWFEFLAAYSTPATCARAPLGDVLRHWQGLGYPRRAKHLHDAASVVVAHHDGSVPATLDELRALPGIGPYTARAVLAFAFETDAAIVDTNVARVLARTAGAPLTARAAQSRADAWLPAGDAWAWNQVLLDLGATVCTPRSPSCDVCPMATVCAWRGVGPDPAIGSAGVSVRQARFEGSDRQLRGRVLKALGERGRVLAELQALVPTADPDRIDRLVHALVAEGLVVRSDGEMVALP